MFQTQPEKEYIRKATRKSKILKYKSEHRDSNFWIFSPIRSKKLLREEKGLFTNVLNEHEDFGKHDLYATPFEIMPYYNFSASLGK